MNRIGIAFSNPKPHTLIDRILHIATGPNDIILDSFAGSGTTAHAVLALNQEDGGNRKFILVECEDYADAITAERVRRVIRGVPEARDQGIPWQTGFSRYGGVPEARDQALREGLSSSSTYCTLGEPIDLDGMLTGEALPEFPALAAYLLYTATGVSAGEELVAQDNHGRFYYDDGADYYLLYQPDTGYLASNEAMLHETRVRDIRHASREAVVFGPGKYIGQRELTSLGITFCQLPYALYRAGR